jgi:acetylornithine deacetylase/succinyl-diaminopimelate desuccinylase-like protein
MTSVPARVFEQIDADFPDHLDRIRAYLRQPSVAALGDGIEAGAELTAELIAAAGGKAEIAATPGSPAVLGRLEGDGGHLLRYGMYDVQPADEPGWDSPPFAAHIRTVSGLGKCVIARGAANSKGCLSAFLLAVESLRKVADLPVSITMMVDGEEELGSPNLPGVIAAHKEDLAAVDAAFDLDLMADPGGVADVYLGVKGILSFRLVARGGDHGGPVDRALHSSSGAAVASPAWSLVQVLDTLVGPDESPRMPGIVPAVVPTEDEPLLSALAEQVDVDGWLVQQGAVSAKTGTDRKALVRALLYDYALNINGLESGYPAGGKTIIPHRAEAVLDLRFPCGAPVEAIIEGLRKTVLETAPGVEATDIEICPAARTSASSSVARAMIASHHDAGAGARVWPSAPWWAPYYLFEQELGLDFAIGGAGHCGGAHAANEYATVDGLRAHMKQSVAFLYRFARSA